MYLILAFVWLICGVGLLAYQALSGDQRLALHLGDVPISCGWVMLLLSAWNVMRWWTRRPARSFPQTQHLSRRQRIRRIQEPTERDPNFIFTDDPPPPPPSQN